MVHKDRSGEHSWECRRIKPATNGAAESHVSENQAGILMQDELQLERHQVAAHDHRVCCEQVLFPGFVVKQLL
jgi:hypothetical protein